MNKVDETDKAAEDMAKFTATAVQSQKQAAELMSNLFNKAGPKAVFGEPVKAENYTVIPASEVWISMGFGFGGGEGSGPAPVPPGTEKLNGSAGSATTSTQLATGSGGGGGGGGVSTSRPVAVISIGPNGVKVTPIVDPTKFILAFWTGMFKTVAALIVTQAKRRK